MKLVKKLQKSLRLGVLVSAPLLSSACALYAKPTLDPAPTPLTECAEAPVTTIPPGAKSAADAANLAANLRKSELSKDRCAKNWAAWYGQLQDR